jgi:alpha-mannosidase II
VKNNYLTATFESDSGLLSDLSVNGGRRRKMNIRFMQYGTVHAMDRSGAYLFLPSGQATSIDVRNPPVSVTSGPLFTEVVTRLQYVDHRVRIYHTDTAEAKSLDIQNTVDIRLSKNLEFIMRIESDLDNKDREFFTDLNGFQMQRRKTLQKLPLQANFYPVPALIFLQDSTSRLSLATQQTNGAASLETGFLEVVLDRRLMQDDNRGLGQGVTDNKVTPSNFKLLLEDFEPGAKRLDVSVPTAYPSSLMVSLMQQLQHPVFSLHITDRDAIDSGDVKRVIIGFGPKP